jgi:hypothetical protein
VLVPGGHLIYSDFHPSWTTKGWRRTFQTADGRSLEIAYFSHTLAEHIDVLEGRSFDIRAVREPRLIDPVAIVFHAVKRGSR